MDMTDNIIEISDLVKIYPTFNKSSIKDFFINRQPVTGENVEDKLQFYRKVALDLHSLNVVRGSKFGILGHNGSGKSTLLSLMLGILKPDHGFIKVHGRSVGLLEMGSGFHPELSGNENVMLYLSILGISISDARALLPSIVTFCELGKAMSSPLRTYSSGMVIRLAFSVLCHVPTDMFLVDEVLAVGDYSFQVKCMDFMAKFSSGGGTIVFVSQDPSTLLNMCDTGLCLHEGKAKAVGPIDEVVETYIEAMEKIKKDAST
jgi:lipopolysaccharide transport system ATP-binding protein